MLHQNVGKEVYKNNVDILICCGENAKYIAKSAEESGMNKNNIFYFLFITSFIIKQFIDFFF